MKIKSPLINTTLFDELKYLSMLENVTMDDVEIDSSISLIREEII